MLTVGVPSVFLTVLLVALGMESRPGARVPDAEAGLSILVRQRLYSLDWIERRAAP